LHRGKYVRTEEIKRKNSEALKGSKSPNYGKPRSEEVRKKISTSHFGIRQTEESKRKISHSLTGRKVPSDVRARMSISHTGMLHSKEEIAKMRESAKSRISNYKNTSIERKLQDILISNGVEFQLWKCIIGHPDIFVEPNICIFADGDYWHANPDRFSEDEIARGTLTVRKIWEKDKEITAELQSQGYIVLRFWEREIKKDIEACENKIMEVYRGKLPV